MRKAVKKDWALEDKLAPKFLPLILSALALDVTRKDMNLDLHKGTDFTTIPAIGLAIRLRRHEYYGEKYKREFTIRWKRPSGKKTEYEKILEGDVRWFFYAFLNERENDFADWFIGDLNIFRQTIREHLLLPHAIRANRPHDSDLAIYEKRSFPNEFIKAYYPEENYVFLILPRFLDYSRVTQESQRLLTEDDDVAAFALRRNA